MSTPNVLRPIAILMEHMGCMKITIIIKDVRDDPEIKEFLLLIKVWDQQL
jgi:hypothetical protein